MNLREVLAYGTSEGVTKAWESRLHDHGYKKVNESKTYPDNYPVKEYEKVGGHALSVVEETEGFHYERSGHDSNEASGSLKNLGKFLEAKHGVPEKVAKRREGARARHAAYTDLGMKKTPFGYE